MRKYMSKYEWDWSEIQEPESLFINRIIKKKGGDDEGELYIDDHEAEGSFMDWFKVN